MKRLLLAGLLLATPAVAHDANHPELDGFYRSLFNVEGRWCCTVDDTAMTEIRAGEDGRFEAWIDERYPAVARGEYKVGWYPIPATARVVDIENIVGEPVVSFYFGKVLCFLDVARG